MEIDLGVISDSIKGSLSTNKNDNIFRQSSGKRAKAGRFGVEIKGS